jgi:hypothetical protein
VIPAENYKVVVPFIPDLRFNRKKRITTIGDRQENRYSVTATLLSTIVLPWVPAAPEWVEVYINGIRLVNPRITTRTKFDYSTGGTLYEEFNVQGSTIRFTTPQSGEILVICDTLATHWSGATIIDPKNHQAVIKKSTVANVAVYGTPVIGGYQHGRTVHISYEVGPTFEANSYVVLTGNSPNNFNGNFQVVTSTSGGVEFRTNTSNIATMHITGHIDGFATNYTWYKNTSIALYAEPVILTQPVHGYARLTTDRQSIAYVPNLNYVGNDTFSWSLITQHGQVGTPKCVYIRTKAA